MNSTLKSLLFWMVLVVVGVLIWNFSNAFAGKSENPMAFSEFLAKVDDNQVQSVVMVGHEITGELKTSNLGNGRDKFRTYSPDYPNLAGKLHDKGVVIQAKPETTSPWAALLYSWAPILLMIGFWIFIMRQMQSGGNKALSFGKSRAKLSSSSQKKVTFKDVSGVDEAKEELQEIIEFLKEPQKFQKLGGRIPKGVLLMGRREPARPFSPAPLPARRTFRSSQSAVLISSRCSSVSARPVFGICSNRERRTRRASCSSTRSMRSGAIAARVSAAATTSASRR